MQVMRFCREARLDADPHHSGKAETKRALHRDAILVIFLMESPTSRHPRAKLWLISATLTKYSERD